MTKQFFLFFTLLFCQFHTSFAVLYELETLKSPDGALSLTAGSDFHLSLFGREHSCEWQQADDYVEVFKQGGHSTALEDPLTYHTKIAFPPEKTPLISYRKFFKKLPPFLVNRRTGNFLQDFLLTPLSSFSNKYFKTSFHLPPINKGFLSNLGETLYQKQSAGMPVGVDITNLELRHFIFFMKQKDNTTVMQYIDRIERQFLHEDSTYKILKPEDFVLMKALKEQLEKKGDKTLAAFYEDKSPIYIDDYDFFGIYYTPEELMKEACVKLLDARTLLHICAAKKHGIKNLDIFMGGEHIKNIITRLREHGWRTVKKDHAVSQNILTTDTLSCSNVKQYFKELRELKPRKDDFFKGMPLTAVQATIRAAWQAKMMQRKKPSAHQHPHQEIGKI